jgi:hypothetical protein
MDVRDDRLWDMSMRRVKCMEEVLQRFSDHDSVHAQLLVEEQRILLLSTMLHPLSGCYTTNKKSRLLRHQQAPCFCRYSQEGSWNTMPRSSCPCSMEMTLLAPTRGPFNMLANSLPILDNKRSRYISRVQQQGRGVLVNNKTGGCW